MNIIFFTLLLLASFSVRSANAEYFHSTRRAREVLSQKLNRYTRPFTYLEIAEAEPLWALDIACMYPESSIIILVVGADSEPLLCRLKQEEPENVVVLHPKKFGLYELEMLGLCESIDQFVMPDLSAYFGDPWSRCVEAASHLAPESMIQVISPSPHFPTHSSLMEAGGFAKAAYGFLLREGAGGEVCAQTAEWDIHVPSTGVLPQQIAVQEQRCLSFWLSQYYPKKGIMLGRWPTDPLDLSVIEFPEEPPYPVKSTYDTKRLHKRSSKPQVMVPGINLKTFVMLRGIWPEDDVLIEKIRSFETSTVHNDLMENNLIVSGHAIMPIDTDDLRWCGDLSLCVARILSLFKDRLRMDDPRAAIKRLDPYGCTTLEGAQKHQQMIQELFPETVPTGTVLSSTWIGVKPMASAI